MNQSFLNECLDYDRATGLLRWKNRPREHFRTERGRNTFNAQKAGEIAGCVSKQACGISYVKVNINKRLHLAHRLAWIILHGDIPDGMEIDHIDHDGTNNAESNIRLVTSSQNKRNRSMVKTNKSGQMGVYFNRATKKWIAEIVCDGRYQSLGSHASIDGAIAARKAREIELGFHPNHGR